MEYHEFSKAQQEAMSLEPGNILVSAGAGSGKTAILIERLHQIFLRMDVAVDQVLLITFANLAADELRERLRTKLKEDSKTKEIANLVDACEITTFDAFALKIVQKYGYLLNLPIDISIVDETIYKLEFQKLYDEVFEKHCENPSDDFCFLVKTFVRHSDDVIFEAIKSIKEAAEAAVDKKTFIYNVKQHYTDENFDRLFLKFEEQLDEDINQIKKILSEFPNIDEKEKYLEIIEFLSTKKEFDEYALYFSNYKQPDLTRNLRKNEPEAVKIIERFRRGITKIKENYFTLGNKKAYYDDFHRTKPFARALLDLYQEIDDGLERFKHKYGAFLFSDIARFATELVKNENVRAELRNQYKFIFVDEYQDTDDIQEELITKISNHNVYMVGDVKQSIYEFRNANIENFKNKYEQYSKNDGGRKYDLIDNFRSRGEVLEDVKKLTSHLIKPYLGEENEYAKDIVAGNDKYKNEGRTNQNYNLDVLTYSKEGLISAEQAELEARIIASDITNKIRNNFMVFDFKKGLRPCEYKDFTILIKTRTHSDKFEKVFKEYQIPLFKFQRNNISEDDIFFALKNIVVLFNNVKKGNYDIGFKHAFTSIARGFLCQYNDEKIYKLIKGNLDELLSDEIIIKIKELVDQYRNAPLYQIVTSLVEEFKFYDKIFLLGDIEEETYKLQKLLAIIENMERYGYSIDDLVTYFEKLIKEDIPIEQSSIKRAENVVSLQTMHGSKGLEYPIVYYASNFTTFLKTDRRKRIRYDDNVGFIFPTNIENGSSLTKVISLNELRKKDILSAIWLLYVALTRAKEKIIIVTSNEENDKVNTLSDVDSIEHLLKLSPYLFEKMSDGKILEPKLTKPALIEQKDIIFNINDLENNRKKVSVYKKTEIIEEVSLDALELGNTIHELLENINFDTRDLSFIKDKGHYRIIEKIIGLSFFKKATNDNVFQEYPFVDEEGGLRFIDCFINLDNKIILLDYKLKNLEHPSYIEQVKRYASYLQKQFKKKIEAHLVALLTGETKEIKL